MTFPEPGLRMLKNFAAGRKTTAENFPGPLISKVVESKLRSMIATISCVRGLMTTI
jgi:hypothetical protein